MTDPFHSNKNLKRGDPTRPFKPGVSGNPRGSLGSAKHELARRIREQTDYGQLLIDYAKACVMGRKYIVTPDGEDIQIPQDPKSRAYCHAWLTERGWGRPKQELVIAERSQDQGKPDVRAMSLEQLRQLAAGEPDEDGGGVH